jgi:indole-3-glycerol phosphate synthase
MPDVLKRICKVKRTEIEQLHRTGEAPLRTRMAQQEAPRGFRTALKERPEVALIAELKKASPSAGVIREDFVPRLIAEAYEEGGARCLSVLTDEKFFQGSLTYLAEARGAASLPVLRKDFILDELQILEARAWGADCVLLIVAALERSELAALRDLARELDTDALVEVHTREELDVALSVEADLIGINNRDLRTFEVRLETSQELAPEIPDDVVVVAESGISSRHDVEKLREFGVDAVLVGESLIRSPDLVKAARRLSEV